MTDLPALDRKLARAAQDGRGVRLDARDISIMAECGALAVLFAMAAPIEFPPLGANASLARARGLSPPFVYFIQRREHGVIKIGQARDVASRLRSLQTASPEPLHLLATSQRHDERELHSFFQRERLRGEWFRPSPRLLAFIETLGE